MVFHRNLSGSELHYARVRTGHGDPNGVVDASIEGEIYIDLDTDTAYYATAAGNSNWRTFSGGGSATTTAVYRFRFDTSNVSSSGSVWYLKTRMPMYADKDYFTIYDESSGSNVPQSDFGFTTAKGLKLGKVSDLTDTIEVSMTYSGPFRVTYTENVQLQVPFFYLARDDGHPVSTTNFIDAFYYSPRGYVRLTGVSRDISNWRMVLTDSLWTRYEYLPKRLYYTFGNDTTGNQWRLEMYRVGKAQRASGVGATDGMRNSDYGPRTGGLGTLVPRYTANEADGYFDLESIFMENMGGDVNGPHETGDFLLRLRDPSTNTVSLFGVQKLRVKKQHIFRRDTGNSCWAAVKIYLVA